MRIKSDVEFVKKECNNNDYIGWNDVMERYCGQEVVSYHINSDGDYECTFSDGDCYYYPPECLEEDVTLEKGKKYSVNGSADSFEFVEESENFAIFEGGIVFKKEGNTFVEHDERPEFLNKKWEVRISAEAVDVLCNDFFIAEISKYGIRMVGSVSKSLGFPLNGDGSVKIVKD